MTQSKPNLGLLILRLGLGIMFLIHGWPKIIGGIEEWTNLGGRMGTLGIDFAPALWGFMGAFSEFGGAILLITGILFTPACALMLLTMAIATQMHVSSGDSFQIFSHPLTLSTVFLGLMFIGPGEWTLWPKGSTTTKSNKELSGKIKRILRNKGFGFITDLDGKQIFFHQTGIVKARFDALHEGQLVKFSIKHTPKGPNAINIRIVS